MVVAAAFTSARLTLAYASPENSGGYSTNLSGTIGVNTIPSARMDKAGTLRAGVATSDPFLHGFAGMQIVDPLAVTLRQTARTSRLSDDADDLHPGVDMKLRLFEETQTRPEISVGAQSLIGDRRMASEYIVFSKRYNAFDFTLGVGTERLAGDTSFSIAGEKIGIFGGAEYFLPIRGFSLKLDYNPDPYGDEEREDSGFHAPSPWGIGLSYTHNGWISADIGTQGTDKVMARLSLQSGLEKWPSYNRRHDAPRPFYAQRQEDAGGNKKILKDAREDGIYLTLAAINDTTASAELQLEQNVISPQQIGRTARIIAAHAGKNAETVHITPRHHNLRSNTITLMRGDLENALQGQQGSPQEIWQNARFDEQPTETQGGNQSPFLGHRNFTVHMDTQASLSETDSGILYRTSLEFKNVTTGFLGFFTHGESVRVHLLNNLDQLSEIRVPSEHAVREDIDLFSRNPAGLDTAFLAATHSFTPSLHGMAVGGYLEEMYAGAGGQLLYRPFDARFAVGAQIWQAWKRSPETLLNLGLYDQSALSGHIEGWYDLPYHDVTLHARAGRFLGGDDGIGIGLRKSFANGAVLSGETVLSNRTETDLLGREKHAYHAINLTLPIKDMRWFPRGSTHKLSVRPLGRNVGQSIDNPIDLYALTEPFSLKHLKTHWQSVLE